MMCGCIMSCLFVVVLVIPIEVYCIFQLDHLELKWHSSTVAFLFTMQV